MAVTRTSTGAFVNSLSATTALFGTGAAATNLGILLVETANEAFTAPSGWTVLGFPNVGSAGVAGGTRQTLCYRPSITSGEVSGGVAVADSGDHQLAALLSYSGADATTPLVASGGFSSASSITSVLLDNFNTTIAVGDIVLAIIATDRDSNTVSTNSAATWTGVTGTSSGFILNGSTSTGAGGGIIVHELVATANYTGQVNFSCSITSSIWAGWIVVVKAPASATSATISAAEATDTASSATTVTTGAAFSANETTDAASVSTTVTTGATLAAAEAADTTSNAAAVTTGAALAATETKDAGSVSATVTTGATISATETTDSAAVTAANWSTAQLAAVEGSDTTAIAATVTAGATITAAETSDATSITASAGSATTSAMAANETTDSGSVTATVATCAGLAASEASDTASVTADNWRTAQVSTTERSDTAAVAAAATTGAALASIEASDTVAADAQNWVTAQVAANDNADIGDGTAGPPAKTYPLAGIPQPYPGTAASYPLVDAQAYPVTTPQTYPLEGQPQQYPLAS